MVVNVKDEQGDYEMTDAIVRKAGPIDRIILKNVRCTRCGAKGVGTCSCWVDCACGWSKGRNEDCRNPKCKSNRTNEQS